MTRHCYPTILMLFALLATTTLSAQEHELLPIVEANFKAADANGDGNLDAAEFPALIDANAEHKIGRASMVKHFGAYERAFRTADQNGDSNVTWSEILNSRAN